MGSTGVNLKMGFSKVNGLASLSNDVFFNFMDLF